MYTWKTLQEDYYDPFFRASYQYIENEILERFQYRKPTKKEEHDIWKCMFDSIVESQPSYTQNWLQNKTRYLVTGLYFILLQKRIINSWEAEGEK